MEELEKLLSGKLFNPHSDELMKIKSRTHKLCQKYNKLNEGSKRRTTILNQILGSVGNDVTFAGPMIFNYGINTTIGNNFYANFNFTCLDDNKVTIGNNVMIGPNCSIMASNHPLISSERINVLNEDGSLSTREFSKPIVIEDDVWLACGVTVLGGVTIGKGAVIGAGSVVTHDIKPNTLALGVPARVIKEITSKDSASDLM